MATTTARDTSRRLADLLRGEQAAMADFLLALVDFDRRRLWVELGHTSLWYYLHRELGLSKGAAFHRKVAAELLQKHAGLEAPLRDGRLCLSSVVELARVLTPQNEAEVLPRFFHRSAREAKEVAAELAPRGCVPSRVVVTPISPRQADAGSVQTSEPTPAVSGGSAAPLLAAVPTPALSPAATLAEICRSAATSAPAAPASARPVEVVPLTADRSRLHLTVSRRLLEKLAAARDALSHSRPGASEEEILEAGLDLLLARQASRRALVKKPRATPSADPRSPSDALAEAGPRPTIPAHVRRAVWLRDEGCYRERRLRGDLARDVHHVGQHLLLRVEKLVHEAEFQRAL
ncbi:MAG TPA: hypothetical protein VFP50_12120, partial [Anaeromyxobacteraceae bacterium]|nr:hypothetical protein [Anaeromyxobacteraceae bacterium]